MAELGGGGGGCGGLPPCPLPDKTGDDHPTQIASEVTTSPCNTGDEGAAVTDVYGSDTSDVAGGSEEGPQPGVVRRRLRTLTFGRRHGKMTSKGVVKEVGVNGGASKKRGGGSASGGGGGVGVGGKGAPWGGFKFNYRLKRSGGAGIGSNTPATLASLPEPNAGCEACVCTGYRRTEEHHLGAGVVFRAVEDSPEPPSQRPTISSEQRQRRPTNSPPMPPVPVTVAPCVVLSRFNSADYPTDDVDRQARALRARELEEGVELPPGFRSAAVTTVTMDSVAVPPQHGTCMRIMEFDLHLDELFADFQNRLVAGARMAIAAGLPRRPQSSELTITTAVAPVDPPPAASTTTTFFQQAVPRTVHTQVDYIHCLVPDLREITDCGFYWGKMDRYEAERLLDQRPEGTFLLRDSAQEEFLFSVSFRRYSRSLHARVEQFKHRFSFDSHDPGVFASDTVCGLIDHYKDPSCCMFFEPMLTLPLHRTFPFPLQHLCRAAISEACTYDGINALRLPKSLKAYLKEYHYKQRVRVRRLEAD